MPGTLAEVTAVMRGRGLYFGNETQRWTTAQWVTALASARRWGFDFVAPKVGGYGATWFATDQALRQLISEAETQQLKCFPWIYSAPSSLIRDARICSEIAHAAGMAFVDIEQPENMAAFWQEYKRVTPEGLPLLVTSGGDPGTWGAGWPGPTVFQTGAVVSPQWYAGEWVPGYAPDPIAAINKADAEWVRLAGPAIPLVPSCSVSKLSPAQISQVAAYLARWKAPVIWWEYGQMSDAVAHAIMAAPVGIPADPPVGPQPAPVLSVEQQLAVALGERDALKLEVGKRDATIADLQKQLAAAASNISLARDALVPLQDTEAALARLRSDLTAIK